MTIDNNIIDLGIIPINMQMIKKDVGLFNIFLNSSLYKEYLSKLDLTDPPVGSAAGTPGMRLTDIDVEGLLKMDKTSKKNMMQLLTAESYLHKYISRELEELNALSEKNSPLKDKFFVLPKHNHLRYELQMRLAIALYSIVKYMKKPDEEKNASNLPTYQKITLAEAITSMRQ